MAGCDATKTEDHYPDARIVTDIQGMHNHNPPTKRQRRLRADVRNRAVDLLQSGVQPAGTELQLQEEAYARGDFSHLTVPDINQVRRLRSTISRSLHPTTDSLMNVDLLHGAMGTKFVQQVQTTPALEIYCAHPRGLAILAQYGRILVIDGTFELAIGTNYCPCH